MPGTALWESSRTHMHSGHLNCVERHPACLGAMNSKGLSAQPILAFEWLQWSESVRSGRLTESNPAWIWFDWGEILNPLVPKSSSNHSSSGLRPSGPSDPAGTERIRLISRCISCSHCSAQRGGAAVCSQLDTVWSTNSLKIPPAWRLSKLS